MPIGIEIEGLAELRAALAASESTLVHSLDEAMADAGGLVATRAQANAPRRSGRLRGSIRAFTEGSAVGGVEVTARRVSRGYPGGFPYPVLIESRRHFLQSAVAQESERVMERFEQVLTDVARTWEG